jgi:hypothetical protein
MIATTPASVVSLKRAARRRQPDIPKGVPKTERIYWREEQHYLAVWRRLSQGHLVTLRMTVFNLRMLAALAVWMRPFGVSVRKLTYVAKDEMIVWVTTTRLITRRIAA